MGRIRKPIYAIVAADTRSPRDGRFIEDLGRYHATAEPPIIEINAERVNYWLDQGAQPTDTVRSLLRNDGILLARHLRKGGKAEEEVEATLTSWKAERSSRAKPGKMTAAERARAVLEEERKRAQAEAAALAKARAEAESKAKAEAAAKAAAEAEAEAAAAAEAETAEAEAKAKAAATEAVETAESEVEAAATEEAETAESETTAVAPEVEAEAAAPADEAESATEETKEGSEPQA